jgi:hypothetical protein
MAHFMMGMLMQQQNMPLESAKSMNSALSLLRLKNPDDEVPCSESMTASRLIETIKSMTARELITNEELRIRNQGNKNDF